MTRDKWSTMFAARIRSRLDYMRMTSSEFCEKLGVDRKRYNRWISGEQIPKAIDIVNIAKVLNCSVSWLIDYNERINED